MPDDSPDGGIDVTAIQQVLQQQGARWTAGPTPLTSLSAEERIAHLGYVPGPGEPSLQAREAHATANLAQHAAAIGAAGYPASFDWRNVGGKNYITPVTDQGGCGSCVAFGTTAAVEATFQVQRGNPNLQPDLSEASLFYCVAEAQQGRKCDGVPNDPLAGWWPSAALDAYRDIGVPDEACFPYTGGDQACNQCSDWASRAVKITGWHAITSVPDMKTWLSTRGPLATCFTVYADFYSYTKGVYHHTTGDYQGGHCVCVVGYDDAGGFWICKNSWDPGWGEGDFFCIGYGEVGIDATMWAVDGIQEAMTGNSYSGVWRAGSDPYYLWGNASQANFLAKWQQLNGQNLRLVDMETDTIGGTRVWTGVWRGGSDAHYLWMNANWNNFVAKWQQLAQQNLRLTVLTTYEEGGTRLYAGVWRAGSDPYYLWANASWGNFVAKWQELGRKNLRLIHLETWPDPSTLQIGGSEATGVGVGQGGGSEATGVGVGQGGGSE